MSIESKSGRKRLLVICPFPLGVAAGQRLKYEQYFNDWDIMGVDVSTSPFMTDSFWQVAYKNGHYGTKALGLLIGHLRRLRDLFRVGQYDAVYIFMWVTPFGTRLFETLYRFFAEKIIFDVEDNVYLEQTLPDADNPNPLSRILKNPGKAKYLIAKADHVITSSPFLNDYCLGINESKRCTYISSSVDTDRFLPVNTYQNDHTIVIGWTGTFSSKIYLDMLRPMFIELAKRARFTLKVIGNFEYALPGVNLEVVQWSAENEVRDLQTFDIGVYPLPVDEWVMGKSGLKAIQYMAFGLPAVATNVGTNPMLIEHGVNGFLVESQAQWLEVLEMLINDPELRRKTGQAARISAVNHYSLKAVAGQYRHVLTSVMEQ